jgi:hypothetical protein
MYENHCLTNLQFKAQHLGMDMHKNALKEQLSLDMFLFITRL